MFPLAILPLMHYCLQIQPMLNPSPLSLPHVPGPAEAMHLGRQKGGETFLLYPHLPKPFLLSTARRYWRKEGLEVSHILHISLPLPIVML